MPILALSLCFLAASCLGGPVARATEIQIEKVVGEVWYSAAKGMPARLLKAGSSIGPGYLRTESNGSFYASPGPDSTFRLGQGSELLIESNEMETQVEGGRNRTAVLRLTQGKITAGGPTGRVHYDIQVVGGQVEMAQGLSVVCIHGDGAHVYVAKGSARIYPRLGKYHGAGVIMQARPSIAVVRDRGDLEIQPLNSAAPGAFSCLLSGAAPEVAAAIEPAGQHQSEVFLMPPHRVNPPPQGGGGQPVSPIQ